MLLKAHMDAVENTLLHRSRIPATAGHTLHRGTPREAFISEFLTDHLSGKLAVGTGEIIDSNSAPRQSRNQFDIIIYNNEYPKLNLGGGINAFLSESVVATIEVKSLLTESELETSVISASKAKALSRNIQYVMTSGYVPPGILSYVVAYDGPASINTVASWVNRIDNRNSLNSSPLPNTIHARQGILSQGIEGVFVLGKGSIIFDNSTISVVDDSFRVANPSYRYNVFDTNDGNILMLFLLLTQATCNIAGQWADVFPYLKGVNFKWSAS